MEFPGRVPSQLRDARSGRFDGGFIRPGAPSSRGRSGPDWDPLPPADTSVKLWAALYLAIWVVFLEFLLGLWPNPPWFVPYGHLALGVAILPIAYYCFDSLRRTRAPGRIKRVAQASWSLSIFVVALGFLLWFHVGSDWTIPVLHLTVYQGILFLHVANAIAVITQLAAVAIAYDMWEDREFDTDSNAGEVPRASS